MRWMLAVFLLSTPAFAEEPRTPSQLALQINIVVSQWAQTIEALEKQVADLQKQLEEVKAKSIEPKKGD